MGATNVQYNGRTATITSDKGSLSADTPEELLARTTGWHAPISQLAYWVVGTSAPNDKNNIRTDNRLDSTHNGDWQAIFEYSDSTLPNRLIITHTDGHRVVMTITHVKQL